MEEEFYNIVEDIVKSEDMESDTTIQAILPDRYYSEISEECSELSELSESMPQSNDNISLSLRCRLCAIAYDDMVDVFSPNVKGHNIIEKIELCLCIMVRVSDTLPKRVCFSCLDKLEMCYNFNEAVAEAEKQLLALDRQSPGEVEKMEICEISSLRNVHCDAADRCHIESTFQTERITETTEDSNLNLAKPSNTHCRNNLKKVLKRNSIDNEWYVTIPWRYDDIEAPLKMDPDVDIEEESRTVEVPENTAVNTIVEGNKLSTTAKKDQSTDTAVERNLTLVNSKSSRSPIHCNDDLSKVKKRNSTDNKPCIAIPWRYDGIEAPLKMDPDVDIEEESRTVEVPENTAVNTIVEGNKLSTTAKKDQSTDTAVERNLTLVNSKSSRSPIHCNDDLSKVKKRNSTDNKPCIAIPWRYDGIETPLKIDSDIHVNNESKTREIPEVRVTTTPAEVPEADHRRSQGDEEISSMHSKKASKNMTNSATHIRERRYKCNLCVKTFKSKECLNRHNKFHTGKGLFGCEYCEKKFTSRGDRSRHHIVHTGMRPFKCFVCKMTFTFETAMKRHAVVHSEVRNYPCSLCDISFKTAAVRKKHMLVHSSKKHWHCDNCETSFKCKDKLRRHMRELHFSLYKRNNTAV